MPGVKDWLKKASSDLKASKKLSDDEETFDCSVFHTHQCAEKAFKAFIVSIHEAIPKTHDLGLLLVRCAKSDPAIMLLVDEIKNLDAYGYSSRYPDDSFYVDKHNTEIAIAMAEKILISIRHAIDHFSFTHRN
jgi:HEPN domain-containing protein